MIESVAGLESAPENGGGRSMVAALWQMREAIAVILGVASTMVALGLVIHELWDRELTPLTMLATSGVSFWAALIASLLVEPATDCYLLRRLLGTGIETLAPLLHKQSLNACCSDMPGIRCWPAGCAGMSAMRAARSWWFATWRSFRRS